MDRRELIAAIGSLPVWSLAAIAQQNPFKLGILLGNSPDPRRETVEHPFGTIKSRMGATHFLMKTLPRVPPRWRSTCSPTI